MSYRNRSEPLFHSRSGSDAFRTLLASISGRIDGLQENQVLNTDPDALAEFYVKSLHVEVPVIDVDNISITESEAQIEVHDRFDGRAFKVPGVRYTVEIPFTGERDIFKLQPDTYNYSPPHAHVGNGVLTFSVEGRTLSAEQVKREIDSTVNGIQQYLGWHKTLWASLDDQVRRTASEHIRRRRDRLSEQKSVSAGLAGMGFKLKEKSGDPKTYVVPAVKQKLQPQMPPMKAAVPPDPKLDRGQYETILGLIRDAGHSIEQSSSRTREMDEEALRDVLLVPLNAHFGKATGEAFNATGKTDILIKHEGGNLFVAECKFWHGEKQFLETIDQLLGYLTWRDTKTAVIMFNRNVGFSAVVEQIRSLPKKHPRYISGPKRLDETSFEFSLSLPNDPERHIVVAVMAFDLGPKEG